MKLITYQSLIISLNNFLKQLFGSHKDTNKQHQRYFTNKFADTSLFSLVDRLLNGLDSQLSGTTLEWCSNETSLINY